MRTSYWISLIALLFLMTVPPLEGAGLRMSPGTFLLTEVPLGRTIDFDQDYGIRLRIQNADSHQTITYSLTALIPSHVDTRATGFFDLPDSSWVRFDSTFVTLGPMKSGEVKMYLTIPDNDAYRNQKYLWVVSIDPVVSSGKGMLSLSTMALYRVETESKPGVDVMTKEVPYITPSVSTLAVAEKAETKVRVINNTNFPKTYRITPLDRESDVARLTILTAKNHRPAPFGTFRCLPDSVTIPPLQSLDLTVAIVNAAGLDPKGGQEEIFMLYPTETGATKGYFRVHTITPVPGTGSGR